MLHVLLGGTGTLGRALCGLLLAKTSDRIRVMARGEHRLMDMRRQYPSPRVSYIVGDVRDPDKLMRVLHDDEEVRVYHMAALKHVHICEYSVLEAVKTNVEGTANVIRAALDCSCSKVALISTDKAVEPTTAYGATKMCAERMFIGANQYAPSGAPAFFCVRYGNVLGSQGSVVETWRKQSREGYVTIANPSVTRFWWTVEDAAKFVFDSMRCARRGDVMVPLMCACTLRELADMVAPSAERREIDGYRTEKLHEVLLSPPEVPLATRAMEMDAVRISYVLEPPTYEQRWTGGSMQSSDCINAAGVAAVLSRA